jgi:sulfate adenylyltransferase (ADP) / ATP adenylyltransferase
LANSDPGLTPDSFWDAVRRRSQSALRAGALQPISTRASYIEDRDVEFVVRVSDNLLRKPGAAASWERSRDDNPFLPPEPALSIGSLPPHHLAVLNKFNVLENHVLVVTSGFVHQESPLTTADFSAAAVGLGHGGALAFYNAGRIAGASQPHRHFQLVPLPLGRGTDIPTAVLFEGAPDGIDTIAPLRFRHAFSMLDTDPADPDAFGRRCFAAYREALVGLGLGPEADEQTRLPPYNLLLTARWLLVVPRSTEHVGGISVNGLGYAGSLFVSTTDRLEYVKAAGPMTLLEEVSLPRH